MKACKPHKHTKQVFFVMKSCQFMSFILALFIGCFLYNNFIKNNYAQSRLQSSNKICNFQLSSLIMIILCNDYTLYGNLIFLYSNGIFKQLVLIELLMLVNHHCFDPFCSHDLIWGYPGEGAGFFCKNASLSLQISKFVIQVAK